MTLAVARRSLGRIVVLSDTKIHDLGATRANSIPGRLKSIVLNRWLTVTYAGLSTQAIDSIRAIRGFVELSTQTVVTHLSAVARQLAGQVEVLVCSHEIESRPRLIKVTSETVTEGADFYWIGNQSSANALARTELPLVSGKGSVDYCSAEERELTRRFHVYIDSDKDSDVGGAVINCLASPYGHCYQDHAGTRVDKREIPDKVSPSVRKEMDQAGMDGYYTYQIISNSKRGVAVVGMYLEQAGIGYIHTPLIRDDPEKVMAPDQHRFRSILEQF